MARRVTCEWAACVLVLGVFAWHGATAVVCLGADRPPGADWQFEENEAEEDLPDINYVKALAEAGRAKSQTRLADYFMAAGDFTNAVFWYRRAAEQEEVPAQLSLAGCLMAGRGAAKNPAEAARWLRRAADRIESSATNKLPRPVPPAPLSPNLGREVTSPANPPALARPNLGHAALKTNSANSAPPQTSVARTNHADVQRVNSLLAPAPTLQEARPVLRPALD